MKKSRLEEIVLDLRYAFRTLRKSPGFTILAVLGALRPAHGRPAAQQQPALAASDGTHHVAGAEELLPPDVVERGRGVLQYVKLVEHDLGAREHRADGRAAACDVGID